MKLTPWMDFWVVVTAGWIGFVVIGSLTSGWVGILGGLVAIVLADKVVDRIRENHNT